MQTFLPGDGEALALVHRLGEVKMPTTYLLVTLTRQEYIEWLGAAPSPHPEPRTQKIDSR